MRTILILAAKELWKKKSQFLLTFLVSFIAMFTVLTAITNATSAVYQQKVFTERLGYDPKKILHLDYQQTSEAPSFAQVLTQFLFDLSTLPGVQATGQFDASGVYFSELKSWDAYLKINSKIVAGKKYENHPDVTQLLCVDASLLSMVKGGVSSYKEPNSGNLPIYASEIFQSILPIGTVLTEERTGETYELVGYFSNDLQWFSEDDLIRFPMVSMKGWFIAPFSKSSKQDIMSQLSCLHNTYLILDDNADP